MIYNKNNLIQKTSWVVQFDIHNSNKTWFWSNKKNMYICSSKDLWTPTLTPRFVQPVDFFHPTIRNPFPTPNPLTTPFTSMRNHRSLLNKSRGPAPQKVRCWEFLTKMNAYDKMRKAKKHMGIKGYLDVPGS